MGQPVEVAPVAQPVVVELQGSSEATRLIARARSLLGQGDISAARTVLERAAETGSASASFMLAETYDPLILSKWGTYGTLGDAAKARELYAKAYSGGIQDAKSRVDALDHFDVQASVPKGTDP
jgi:TPR repeat protein